MLNIEDVKNPLGKKGRGAVKKIWEGEK